MEFFKTIAGYGGDERGAHVALSVLCFLPELLFNDAPMMDSFGFPPLRLVWASDPFASAGIFYKAATVAVKISAI